LSGDQWLYEVDGWGSYEGSGGILRIGNRVAILFRGQPETGGILRNSGIDGILLVGAGRCPAGPGNFTLVDFGEKMMFKLWDRVPPR
jgi:hypothetical protein